VIVSNHVSWLDIIYFGTRLKRRASFVAKKEINDLPVVSAIAAFLRTVVVDRKDKNSKQTTTEGIRQRVS
jgi:lysophosphatidylcholine acyltransferase / lyso-PAF acetyltransferase